MLARRDQPQPVRDRIDRHDLAGKLALDELVVGCIGAEHHDFFVRCGSQVSDWRLSCANKKSVERLGVRQCEVNQRLAAWRPRHYRQNVDFAGDQLVPYLVPLSSEMRRFNVAFSATACSSSTPNPVG